MASGHEFSSINDFFKSKSVLITGGTGFLGGVLLEKLLRSCHDIKNIFLLIRPRAEKDLQTRVNNLLESPLFSAHGKENLNKVIGVTGDLSKTRLGLKEDDLTVLKEQVHIVFHVGATVNFNANLKSAVETNLTGTKRILELCHLMPNIKALVYVSSAFCNPYQSSVIEERVYPTCYDPNHIIQISEHMTCEEASAATPRFLCDHPNTYSLTKHLAENLIVQERRTIPVAIIRPSVVLGTYKEPFPGWVGNVNNGALAFIAGAGKGVFRSVMADAAKVADIVPCDKVTNLIIAAAWNVAVNRDKNVQVYHCCTGHENPISWGDYTHTAVRMLRKNPCEEMLWIPGAECRISWIRNIVAVVIVHFIPALLFDFIALVLGKESKLFSIHQKYWRGLKHVRYFTSHNWHFSTYNKHLLSQSLTPEDKDKFCFSVNHIDWSKFLEHCVLGVRQYYHKECPSTVAKARENIKWLQILHMMFYVSFLLLSAIVFCCFTGTSTLSDVFTGVVFAALLLLLLLFI